MDFWNETEIDILLNNYKNMNKIELQQNFFPTRSIKAIQKKLNKMGFSVKSIEQKSNRIYDYDSHYFKTESHDMAYILGLWYADGYIYTNNRGCKFFSIAIHNDDSYILQKILDKMNSNYPLQQHSETVKRFIITSKEFYNDIINIGGCERKSLNLIFPKLSKEFIPSFIRGFFDGDGCINYHKDMNIYRTTFTCADETFLEQLHKEIKEINSKILGKISFHQNDASGIFHLTFYKWDTIELGKIIYSGKTDLGLIRKYNKFIEAYKLTQQEV
jgi:hypothetical protein